jgi:hypothetical protein
MHSIRTRRTLALVISVIAFTVIVPGAAADSVYHTEKLPFAAVGDRPFRSGFVLNIKAEGPTIYAHEVYVLSGAAPRATYTVTNNFYVADPECLGTDIFPTDTAVMATGPRGNARADVFFVPADVEGFEGVHGVIWTLRDPEGDVAYQTTCTAVTLD